VDFFLELVAWLFADLFVNLIGTFVADLLFHGLARIFGSRRPVGPLAMILGYAFLALGCGALNITLWPQHFIKNLSLRRASLIITPILAGLAMSALGSFLQKRHRATVQLETFTYGFLFAFIIQLMRYLLIR
jgi:hypothetical protein